MTNEPDIPPLPSTPPPFSGGFLRKGGTDHRNRRDNIAWLAENGESPSLRRKAQEILEGKRSSYEIFRDPEFGKAMAKGMERFGRILKEEGIDVSDPSTHPSPEKLRELKQKYGGRNETSGRSSGSKTGDETSRSWFDRRTRADNADDEMFRGGSREDLG